MLRLKRLDGSEYPVSDYTDYCIKHKQDGKDTLSFCLPVTHEQYPLLENEAIIRTDQNEYLIKKIDEDKVDCELNLDFLKNSVRENYVSATRTLAVVLYTTLPSSWTVNVDPSATERCNNRRRSIKFDYCTDLDIIDECADLYDVAFVWHILDKTVDVVAPDLMPVSGTYLTTELNLRKQSYKGKTSDFCTRLYAFGAEGMTMETAVIGETGSGDAVFYGKKYVEDFTYSNKVICGYWTDERYTVPENLLEAAQKKIQSLSKPVVSYDCAVEDLAKQDDGYAFLELHVHKKVILIDPSRGTRIVHQVVEYKEWPDGPKRNSVTLASVPETIQTKLKTETNALKNVNIGLSSRITKNNAAITLEVENRIAADEALGARLTVAEGDIAACVTMEGGTNASFGWHLTLDGHSWYADGKKVAEITRSGAKVEGEIIAKSGTIGGCVIDANGVLKVGNANITNINAEKITAGVLSVDRLEAKSIVADKIADGAATERVIGTGAVTGGKIGSGAVSTGKIADWAVSYGKTGFTGTLDQVGINASDISSIDEALKGNSIVSISCDRFYHGGYAWGAETLYFDDDGVRKSRVFFTGRPN